MTNDRVTFATHIDRPRAVLFLALSLASALTEGIGLLLLVPMLGLLGGGARMPGEAGALLQRFSGALTLNSLLAIFVLLVLIRAVIKHWAVLVSLDLQHRLIDGLRMRAWRAILHCDWRVLSRQRQTDIASLLISNVDRVGNGALEIVSIVTIGFTLAGLGAASLVISPTITAIAAICGLFVLIGYRGLRRRAGELGEALGSAYQRVFGEVAEGLGALRVIKSFGAEDRSQRVLATEFVALRSTERRFVWDQGVGQIALQGGGAALLAGLVWYAIRERDSDMATVLPMVVLFGRALPLLGNLQESWQRWLHDRPALAATRRLIGEAEAAREPDSDPSQPRLRPASSICLMKVSLSYPGRAQPALDGIDLELPVGTITSLNGPSGSGKSSIADLIGGLLAPEEGALALDGIPLDSAQRRAWRGEVAYVQQEPVLFTGSIRDNLSWADPTAEEGRMLDALGLARAGFVESLPLGLDTLVGEGGRHLSGGERQRIVLARALMRSPQLLILDEAASALDRENEEAIASAIAQLRNRMTILVTGHGGALSRIADRMVEISGGRIIPTA